MINLLVRLFGGTIKARFAGYVTMATLWIVAQVAKYISPEVAATIHPDAVAGFISAIILNELNSITNKTKNAGLASLQNVLQEANVEIPVKAAVAVNTAIGVKGNDNLTHLH